MSDDIFQIGAPAAEPVAGIYLYIVKIN